MSRWKMALLLNLLALNEYASQHLLQRHRRDTPASHVTLESGPNDRQHSFRTKSPWCESSSDVTEQTVDGVLKRSLPKSTRDIFCKEKRTQVPWHEDQTTCFTLNSSPRILTSRVYSYDLDCVT